MKSKTSIFDRIGHLCANYPMRFVESGMQFILLAPAAYIINERVRIAGLVQAPSYAPIWMFSALMLATCLGHQVCILMPMIHRWLEGRGVKHRLLIKPWFQELTWRRWCCGLAIAEMGFYAAVISQLRLTPWLLALPYMLIMNVALIRLGRVLDANRTTDSSDPLVGDADPGLRRRNSGPVAILDHLNQATPKGSAERRSQYFRYPDREDTGWRERALNISKVG